MLRADYLDRIPSKYTSKQKVSFNVEDWIQSVWRLTESNQSSQSRINEFELITIEPSHECT
ncbi:hypothetical protein NH340_JMT06504 [Sarcoptes scabiei]|nr:hypothetical protein NH340_JMT06504 [Sarcoptes scabiei]